MQFPVIVSDGVNKDIEMLDEEKIEGKITCEL